MSESILSKSSFYEHSTTLHSNKNKFLPQFRSTLFEYYHPEHNQDQRKKSKEKQSADMEKQQ